MVRVIPSTSSRQYQQHCRLRKTKQAKKTIHITIHPISTTSTNTNKLLDNKQRSRFDPTETISSSTHFSKSTTPAFNQRKTLLQSSKSNISISIDKELTNSLEHNVDQKNSSMNDTTANYMDYKNNQKRKRMKCKRPICVILSILTAIAVILSVLICLTILLINRKGTDTATTSITTSTTFSTSTSTASCIAPTGPVSRYAKLNASNYYLPAGTPTQQADGLLDRPCISNGTYFNAGAYAPQWIQLELPSFYNISSIALLVQQSGSTLTQHRLYVGSNPTSLQLVTNLTGNTYTGLWLNITYNPVLTDVRFIKLISVSSPSWIAWMKFIVNSI